MVKRKSQMSETAGAGVAEHTVTESPVAEPAAEILTERESTTGTPLAVAMEAIKEGSSEAREAAAEFIPAVGQGLKKAVYQTFYGVSYGVVYSALVVASLVPTNNVMGEGLRDGAEDAGKAFRRREEERTAEEGVVVASATAEEAGAVPA